MYEFEVIDSEGKYWSAADKEVAARLSAALGKAVKVS